jgi:diguanylate cyclase (GGDEF)-like protein
VPTHLVGQVQRQLLSSLPESSRALFETDGRSRSDGYLAREIPANHGRTLEVDQQPITHDEQYFGRLWLVRDITGQKRREAILETLAATDALTRLPNRRAFIAHLEQYAQDLVRGTQQSGAVLMIDLDFFKRINDSYGHGVGDKVLQQTASVIRHTLRADDVAGRLGGEEFAVLLPGAPADHACEVAERLRAAIADVRVEVNEGLVHVTASIGVHAIADATLSSDDWLARADSALYRAKHEGRNRVVRDQ